MIRNRLAVRRTRLWLQRLEDRDLPTFLTAPTYSVGGTVRASVIADFNGDGAFDVAVAHTQTGGKISVLITTNPQSTDAFAEVFLPDVASHGPASTATKLRIGDGS